MDEKKLESLRAKLAEAETKARQLEADLYYMQGYVACLREQIAEAEKDDNPTTAS